MAARQDSALLEEERRTSDPRAENGRKRVQFEFAPDAFERLQTLKERTDAATYSDVIRNAMRLYEWFIDKQQQGYQIGLIRDDKLEKRIEFYF